jgi:hypothetical protein
MSRLAVPLLFFVASAAGVACKSTSRNDMIDAGPSRQVADERPSLAVPTGGGPMSIAGALNVLATARCYREQLCGRIGHGRTYRDQHTCERTALQAHADDVTLLQCKSGIDGKRLDACATKLRAAVCETGEVAAAETCGTARLCLKE